jgi:hypothetical protein
VCECNARGVIIDEVGKQPTCAAPRTLTTTIARSMGKPSALFTRFVEEAPDFGKAVLAQIVSDNGVLFTPYAYRVASKV